MLVNNHHANVVIVDDEQEACDNIVRILAEFVDFEINIVGIAHDTEEAERLIKKVEPDAVFLDIEMPGENAFQFLERMYPYNFNIIFITAYDEFAIRAFRLNAIDYILKPICIDELTNAVSKLGEQIDYQLFLKHSKSNIDALKQISNGEQPSKITLKSLNYIEIVELQNIYSFEAMGNYCKVTFIQAGKNRETVTSYSISHYEEILPPQSFYRVHKSYIINCAHLKNIVHGDNYHAVIANDKIPISRRRYTGFIEFLINNNYSV